MREIVMVGSSYEMMIQIAYSMMMSYQQLVGFSPDEKVKFHIIYTGTGSKREFNEQLEFFLNEMQPYYEFEVSNATYVKNMVHRASKIEKLINEKRLNPDNTTIFINLVLYQEEKSANQSLGDLEIDDLEEADLNVLCSLPIYQAYQDQYATMFVNELERDNKREDHMIYLDWMDEAFAWGIDVDECPMLDSALNRLFLHLGNTAYMANSEKYAYFFAYLLLHPYTSEVTTDEVVASIRQFIRDRKLGDLGRELTKKIGFH